MEIGEKIKRARQEAGITQAELARRLNVTPQTISQYERGLINPKYETALKFAEALDLQPSWLFGAKLGELETGNADKEHASHGMLWKLLNPAPVETKKEVAAEEFRRDIFFTIGNSVIAQSQASKITEIVKLQECLQPVRR